MLLYPQALKAHLQIQELNSKLILVRTDGKGQQQELSEAEREIFELRILLSEADEQRRALAHNIDLSDGEGAHRRAIVRNRTEASVRLCEQLCLSEQDNQRLALQLKRLESCCHQLVEDVAATKHSAVARTLSTAAAEAETRILQDTLQEALRDEESLLSELDAAESTSKKRLREVGKVELSTSIQVDCNTEAGRVVTQQRQQEAVMINRDSELKAEMFRLQSAFVEGQELSYRLLEGRRSLAHALAELWQANGLGAMLHEELRCSTLSASERRASYDVASAAVAEFLASLAAQVDHGCSEEAILAASCRAVEDLRQALQGAESRCGEQDITQRLKLTATSAQSNECHAKVVKLQDSFEGLRSLMAQRTDEVQSLQGAISKLDANAAELENRKKELEMTIEEQRKKCNCTVS